MIRSTVSTADAKVGDDIPLRPLTPPVEEEKQCCNKECSDLGVAEEDFALKPFVPSDTICWEHPIDTLLEPCDHVTVCFGCTKNLKKCPICREDITNVLKLQIPQTL